MKKTSFALPLRFGAFLLLLCALSLLFSRCADAYTTALYASPEPGISHIKRVVLDAGHGGEDGGASSQDGILEKELNLKITLLLAELLRANGVEVILTRSTDTLLYDRNVDYHGRKKALDLAERKRIAEDTADSIFVSIHMNTYPQADCKGLQVWYSPNDPASYGIAEQIQRTTRTLLQPENDRRIKEAGSGIYLLHHIQTPCVLVECGFLSSPEEAAMLNTPEYQKKLAFVLFCAIMQAENPFLET